MLWESAWVNGNGAAIPDSKLHAIDKDILKGLYDDTGFLPSKALGQIDSLL